MYTYFSSNHIYIYARVYMQRYNYNMQTRSHIFEYMHAYAELNAQSKECVARLATCPPKRCPT